ncbi:alpha/beta hydrolase [Bradyrhizobium sp. BRP22]|uniref:esterase/lipase family protein n=1 Tax=Bradyrhizobium sp. BRP22 TaxID=2793821 RepID=UPI001CD690E9|nr:alpha/beta hydrolase [Bradyrhizobium sp. BRP22]MCA1452271.1 alpha/beta hydrolase [Bradyrhizobium sp. BRP22]
MFSQRILRLLTGLLCLFTFAGGENDARAEGTENSHYARREDRSKTVIVFVHGWTGNAVQTWTNPKTGAYWPDLLRTDPAFAGMNIYVLEYPAAKTAGGLTITDISEALYARLVADQIMSYDKVIFLAHSLGGLTVRQMLLAQRDLAEKVSFLFFFGTPTEGSDLARIGQYLSHDPVIPPLTPIDRPVDAYLSVMMRLWGAARFPFKTYCSFERQRTKGVFIVSELSATRLCTEQGPPINETHENMVKPADTRADSYIALRNVLPQYNKPRGPGVETVDVKRTIDASRIKCGARGEKVDEVDIVDELHFVDSPPSQYLARAEEMPGETVRVHDLISDSEPPPDIYESGRIRYFKVKVTVKDDYAKVRYAWRNAHSGDEIEVWARPRALLRDFSATLKLPPGVDVRPKSIRPQEAACEWTDQNKTISCTKVNSRDEPIVVTWDWDAWKSCKTQKNNRQKK